MHLHHVLLALASVALLAQVRSEQTLEQRAQQLEDRLAQVDSAIQAYKTERTNLVGKLSRQVMRQWLDYEERMRSRVSSGIKSIRGGGQGTRSFYSQVFTGHGVNSLHNHNNNRRTVGMGEVGVVMNGVFFRTRHNDYSLSQASPDSSQYGLSVYVDPPEVPLAVSEKETVLEQAEEMKEWFKAWQAQDHSVRDYRPFFRPIMCYMQGMWTMSEGTIDEPFASDRHFVDATTWWNLQQKIRYTGGSGTKDSSENLTFLPMKIAYLINGDTEPVYAQWNFKILCGYVDDIPLANFRKVENLTYRMRKPTVFDSFAESRKARFFLHDSENVEACNDGYCYLDSVMEQLPGVDNYPGNITDPSVLDHNGQPLNQAYYHRFYKSNEKDAMGSYERRRGYADDFLYMARTTSERVAPTKIGDLEERWTYAIPLEVIYMTPLYKWNPHNFTYVEDAKSWAGKQVDRNRNGGCQDDTSRAYKGMNRKKFFQTPMEFYSDDDDMEADEADTGKDAACVVDPEGGMHLCAPAGTRLFTLNIRDGVGPVRLRYPITLGSDEGTVTHKEVLALREIVMRMDTYQNMFHVAPQS